MYKQKCENLERLIQQLGTSTLLQIGELKDVRDHTKEEVEVCSQFINTFQTKIRTAIEQLSSAHRCETEEKLNFQTLTTELTHAIEKKDAEHTELARDLERVRSNYEQVLAELNSSDKKREDLEAELELVEEQVTSRLTLEHELELDQLKCDTSAELESSKAELTDLNQQILQHKDEIKNLSIELEAASSVADKKIEERQVINNMLEQRLAELTLTHTQEMENEKQKLEQNFTGNLNEALINQSEELTGEHQLEYEVRPGL